MVDYRALNSVTKSDGFPLPQVIDILDWLGGGKPFAKLDLANGYWQVPARDDDREKTAVVIVHFRALWSQDRRSYHPNAHASHIF